MGHDTYFLWFTDVVPHSYALCIKRLLSNETAVDIEQSIILLLALSSTVSLGFGLRREP
jgi:hypothetical protein